MTIPSTGTRVQYTGNGSTTAFAVSFIFYSEAELEVIERVIATGVETIKTLTTHYTVSGGDGSTGTVTAVAAPASTVQWVIKRKTFRTQLTDYQANDAFPAETHEQALDRAVVVMQEQDEALGRTISFPDGEPTTAVAKLPPASSRANKAFVFDASGGVGLSVENYVDLLANVTAQAALAAANAASAAASAVTAANGAGSALGGANLKQFGALGDGATDDSAAIVAANAAANADVIYVPSGTYDITGVTFDKIYFGEGRLDLDGALQAENIRTISTPPSRVHAAAADGEHFFVGPGAFADRKMLRLTSGARPETYINAGVGYIYPYELMPGFIEIENGTGFNTGSGTTTVTSLGAGSNKVTTDTDYRRSITAVTAASSAVVTVGSHNFEVGDNVQIWDIVGTAGVDVLNNRQHEVTAVDATTVTIAAVTTGKTYTSGGTMARRANRTGIPALRVFADHWGGGDLVCYNTFARVNVETEGDDFLTGAAGVLFNGDVVLRANGTYGNPFEIKVVESNGADAAAVGAVFNLVRTTDTSTKFGGSFNQSNDYSAKDAVWIGVRPQSKSGYCDAIYSGAGLWKVGLDLTAVTFAGSRVAVALKPDDRIHYNATAKVNADKSGVPWYATEGIDAANSVYTHFNSAGNKWELVVKNVAALQVLPTQVITPLRINTSSGVSVAGLPVLGPRATGWSTPLGATDKTALTPYAAPTISGSYVQAEVQAIAAALEAHTKRLNGVVIALHQQAGGHGQIGN